VVAEFSLPQTSGDLAAAMFSEEPSRVVASLPRAHLNEVKRRAARALVPLLELGSTARDALVFAAPRGEIARASLAELREARERCLSPIVGE